MYEKIETKDLILAKAKMEDLEAIHNNFWSEEETAKYMLWIPSKSIEESRERLESVIEFQKTRPYTYFVYEKSTMQAIGMAGIKEIEPNVYEDAGIGIGSKFQHKGYGKQILLAFIDLAKNELKAKRFVCGCDSRNIPSARLQQSCGLKYSHSTNEIRKKDDMPFVQDHYDITF